MANSHCLSFCPCSRRVAVTIPTVTPASPVFSSPRFLPRFLGVAAGSRGGGLGIIPGRMFFSAREYPGKPRNCSPPSVLN